MKFLVHNQKGKILRTGMCSGNDFSRQAHDGEFVMEDTANDLTQKIEFDGFDEKGQPINSRVINKTPEEIEADNPTPPEIPFEQKPAHITNEQWQAVQNRLADLESKT